MHTQKTGSDLQLIASHPVFQFETEFFSACLFRMIFSICVERGLSTVFGRSDDRCSETFFKMIHCPFMPGLIEACNGIFWNRQRIIEVVSSNCSVEYADVGANAAEPKFGDSARAQVVVQISVLETGIAIFIKLIDKIRILVGIEPLGRFSIKVMTARALDVMWREQFRFRMVRVVFLMSVRREDDIIAVL